MARGGAPEVSETVRATAPGRVNLIGDHTDYTGGFALPMAIDRQTVVELTPGGSTVVLKSDSERDRAVVPLDVTDPAACRPEWARYVAGVVAVMRPTTGGRGTITSTVPAGSGLSSSAALEVAVALALGFTGSALDLARTCQQAEQVASGVPCGILDQLTSAMGRAGHALLIDCGTYTVTPVPLPDGVDILVLHSGVSRKLTGTAYAERRAQCEAAVEVVGPLCLASADDLGRITDPLLRRRARHVVAENARVLAFAECLRSSDLRTAGWLMLDSHRSLRDDFEVSTPELDALIEKLLANPRVFGARLTGAGFGGAVVALVEPGARVDGAERVKPAAGATVERLP